MSDEIDDSDEVCSHEDHEHINPELLQQIIDAVHTTLRIDNLFVMYAPNPARFIITNVNRDGTLQVLGFIPFDYMLEVSIGLTRAVQQTTLHAIDERPNGPSEPSSIGPFKVI